MPDQSRRYHFGSLRSARRMLENQGTDQKPVMQTTKQIDPVPGRVDRDTQLAAEPGVDELPRGVLSEYHSERLQRAEILQLREFPQVTAGQLFEAQRLPAARGSACLAARSRGIRRRSTGASGTESNVP